MVAIYIEKKKLDSVRPQLVTLSANNELRSIQEKREKPA